MSDLGALLRKAREQQGYTLDDIQEVTKIRKRYLEAIETGDYKVLPGSFYVRAFVKTYAETVGLDAEEVLRLYHKELPKPDTPENAAVEPMIKKSRRSEHHRDRWGKVTVTLLMWLFPILIVAVVYVYLSNQAHDQPREAERSPITTETATPTDASPSVTTPASPTVPETEPASPTPSTVTFTLKEKRGAVQYVEVSPGGPHQLQLELTGNIWVGVNEGNSQGKPLLAREFQESDVPQTLSFDLTGPLYVNVGRADNVTISIGGTPFDDGDEATSRKFVFMPAAGADAGI